MSEPKKERFEDIAVGDKVFVDPASVVWVEKIRPEYSQTFEGTVNAITATGTKTYIYPAMYVWRKQ